MKKLQLAVIFLVVIGLVLGSFACAKPAPPPPAPAPPPPAPPAPPKPPTPQEKIIEAAKTEEGLVWYESSPDEQVIPILDAFKKKYPFVKKTTHVLLRAADVGARIVTEMGAGVPTGDVGTTGVDTALMLNQRGLLLNIEADMLAFGLPKQIVVNPYSVITVSPTYVFIYNTKLVSEADAPKSWEDFLLPKWKGKKIGIWSRPNAIANLVQVWGKEKTFDWARKFALQDPVFFESNFPLSAAVAAGDLPVGISLYHTTFPEVKKGAPVKMVVPDPTSVDYLASFIPKGGKNPNTAKLFVAWLNSLEGNKVYEDQIDRGNPFIPGTKQYELLKGRTLASFPAEKAAELAELLKQLEDIVVKKKL